MMVRADHGRFGGHVRQFGRLAVIVPALLAGVDKACAINWEGHDSWFYDTAPFRDFYDHVPSPKVKPLPACDARRALHEQNRYEQTAIPGVNCIEAQPPKAGS